MGRVMMEWEMKEKTHLVTTFVMTFSSTFLAHQGRYEYSYMFNEHLPAGHRVVSAKLLLPMWELGI